MSVAIVSPADLSCADVRVLVERTAVGARDEPTAAQLAHVASCATCQGALAALRAFSADRPDPIDCAACQDNLAAYIDLEHTEGAEAALRAYPAVGWHLLNCAECAETRALTVVLLAAERVGLLRPLPQPRRRLSAVTLVRAALQQLLPPPGFAAAVLRGGAHETVLLVQDDPALSTVISLLPQSGDHWSLFVDVEPPQSGQVRLTLGALHREAPLQHGRATFADLPAAAIAAADGPDLTAIILAAEA